MSRSGSHTSSLNFLLFLVEVSHSGCLLGGTLTVLAAGLSSNLVFLGCLLGWTLLSGTVSETKTWDVLNCLILPLHGAERTVFESLLASCFGPEVTKFSLLDGVFAFVCAERTELRYKKEACIIGMSGLLGLMWERFPLIVKIFHYSCINDHSQKQNQRHTFLANCIAITINFLEFACNSKTESRNRSHIFTSMDHTFCSLHYVM